MTTSTRRWNPAIIFLAVVAVLIIIVLGIFAWIGADPARTLRIAFVPGHDFASETAADPLDYSDDDAWYTLPSADAGKDFDVFFLHPTTLLDRRYWTDPLDDPATLNRTDRLILQGQALPFAGGALYVPKYRQATFGAFLDTEGSGLEALILAYGDVVRAFNAFLDRIGDRPFVLAGHSQGSLHLARLLMDQVVARGLQSRLIAAYPIGWPLSIEHDIGALDGIDPCVRPDQTQCALSWQTFGVDGDPAILIGAYGVFPGLNGSNRAGTPMLCVNPLTMTAGSRAGADQHLGARFVDPDETRPVTELAGMFGAACDESGILFLDRTPPEAWHEFKMAGDNFHPYDIHFFFENLRQNVALRAESYFRTQSGR